MGRGLLVLLSLGVASAACTPGTLPPGIAAGVPAVFPSEARLGSTVALVLDSNRIPLLETNERNNLSRDNVEVSIEDAAGAFVPVTLRSVFYGRPGAHSVFAEQEPGAWVAVALFDLPADLGFSSYDPAPEVSIRVSIDGGSPDPYRSAARIQITGDGGTPQSYYYLIAGLFEEALEPLPAVRIRARDDAGAFAWQDGQGGPAAIGAIEFHLDYPACLSNPRAAAASDAERGTVLLADQGGGTVKVMLIHPSGFTLPKNTDSLNPSNPFAGGGPFLEVAFDSTCGFDPAQFDVRELLVADPMGGILLDERQQTSSLQHFSLYTLNDE